MSHPLFVRWPSLTETLTGPRDRHHCQSCGVLGCREHETLAGWEEHDDSDEGGHGRYLLLCRKCSRKLVGPHPRLYRELTRFEPMPGLMALCDDCVHFDRLRCHCPSTMFNGGEGMRVEAPGHVFFMCGRGYRGSGRHHDWKGPATFCAGKEPVP